jgi:hypothetical protein
MWAIGWRKSSDTNQIVGRYIKAFNESHMFAYDFHYKKSARIGKIIGTLFKNMAHIPFQKNQDLMKEFDLPDFASLSFNEPPADCTCSPHITFTTNQFFNPPHKDKEDISEYAFALFLPSSAKDGTLVNSSLGYDVSSGQFVFPDHRFGIDFDHQHGVVKMIWQANKYTHCTMPSCSSSQFYRLGLSVQINYSLALTCDKYMKGYYRDLANYFADHLYYLNRCIGRGTLVASLFLFTLLISLL